MAGEKQTAPVIPIAESYPASPMQQGILFHGLSEPHSGVDIEQILCTLPKELNAAAFRQAWERAVERHEILRTSFRVAGLEPKQEVRCKVRLHFEQKDWRGLTEREQEARLNAYLLAERRRGFELSAPPLMRLALFHAGEKRRFLAWTFHHLLLDDRALVLLLGEVFDFYEAIHQGCNLNLPAPRPYRDNTEWLKAPDWSDAETFWRDQLKGFTAPTPFVVKIRYGQGRFQEAAVARMLGDFQSVLKAKAADLSRRVADLPLLVDTEQRQLLAEWNKADTDFPRAKCVREVFETQVERAPNAVALVYTKGEVSYRELDNQANRVAIHLRSLGVEPEVPVGNCGQRPTDMAVGLLGTLKASGACVPLDPAHPIPHQRSVPAINRLSSNAEMAKHN